jgi:drug/metabolite transporter (DMT)-like permease
VWSTTWLVIRKGLDVPPWTAAAARFALAGAAMIPLAAWLRRRETGTAPPWWLWSAVGATSFASSYGILYVSETSVPSGIAAVLWAVFPALMAVAGHFVLGEPLTPRRALGIAIALAGIVLLGCFSALGGGQVARGDALFLLLSPVVSAIGTTLVKRFGRQHSSLLLNRNAMLAGAVLLAATAALLEHDRPCAWSAAAIGAVAYLALIGTCLTFGVYYWLMRWAPASDLALVSYVTPVLALLLGWLVGDHSLDAATIAGSALVAVGVALVLGRVRAARQ